MSYHALVKFKDLRDLVVLRYSATPIVVAIYTLICLKVTSVIKIRAIQSRINRRMKNLKIPVSLFQFHDRQSSLLSLLISENVPVTY